ncbi:hypothetical protein [Streptomyces rochei]|uniref:hypothetical protein n=1 Tax=Streptomyces rochei TaxID=1928 RepID=UPI003637B65E
MASWNHRVFPLTAEKLELVVELGETCGARGCQKTPTWVTCYEYVTGSAGRSSERRQRVCAGHALKFAEKHDLQLNEEARRAAEGRWDDVPDSAQQDRTRPLPGGERGERTATEPPERA